MEKRFTKGEICFFTAYVLWLLFAVIKLTYLQDLIPIKKINGFVEDAVPIILIVKFLEDEKYEKKAFAGLIILGILFYVSKCSNAASIMLTVYFIYSARNIAFEYILKATMAVQLLVMTASVWASLLGIIPNEIWDAETRSRYSLGYTFCTYGSHIFFFMTLMYIALRKRLLLLEVIGLLAGNYIWFFITNTRIDLLLSVPAILLAYVWEYGQKEMKGGFLNKLFFVWSGPLIAVGAVLAHVFYTEGNPIWEWLDLSLNGRLSLGNSAISQYGITFFGQYIKWIGRGSLKKHPDWIYNYVDSSYLKYLLHHGIFFMIVLITGIVLAGIYLVKKEKNKGLCIAFLFWLIYGAVDAELFVLSFQPFILLCGIGFRDAFCDKEAGKKKECFRQWKIDSIQWRYQ